MAYLGDKEELPVAKDEKREPQSLWDMFMDYMKDKDKAQEKRFVEMV